MDGNTHETIQQWQDRKDREARENEQVRLRAPKQQVASQAAMGSVLGGQQSSPPATRLGEAQLPQGLQAMKHLLDPQGWQRVLEERALLMVKQEARRRQEDEAGLSYQRGYQARQQVEGQQTVKAIEERGEFRRRHAANVLSAYQGRPDPFPEPVMEGLLQEQVEKEAVRQQVERRLHGLGGEQVKAQPQPEPASEMDQALCAANKAHRALDDAVTKLEGRLERVLRPELTGNGPNACPVMAPLPMEIMACSACAMDAVDRLTSILDRLVL